MTIEHETKDEMLKKIHDSQPVQGKNSMGVSESYYNAYYMIGKRFTAGDLNEMTERELRLILLTANFAGEVFY